MIQSVAVVRGGAARASFFCFLLSPPVRSTIRCEGRSASQMTHSLFAEHVRSFVRSARFVPMYPAGRQAGPVGALAKMTTTTTKRSARKDDSTGLVCPLPFPVRERTRWDDAHLLASLIESSPRSGAVEPAVPTDRRSLTKLLADYSEGCWVGKYPRRRRRRLPR